MVNVASNLGERLIRAAEMAVELHLGDHAAEQQSQDIIHGRRSPNGRILSGLVKDDAQSAAYSQGASWLSSWTQAGAGLPANKAGLPAPAGSFLAR